MSMVWVYIYIRSAICAAERGRRDGNVLYCDAPPGIVSCSTKKLYNKRGVAHAIQFINFRVCKLLLEPVAHVCAGMVDAAPRSGGDVIGGVGACASGTRPSNKSEMKCSAFC